MTGDRVFGGRSVWLRDLFTQRRERRCGSGLLRETCLTGREDERDRLEKNKILRRIHVCEKQQENKKEVTQYVGRRL